MHWHIYERGMEFGWLFILIFSVLIVFGVIHLIGLVSRSGRKERHGESPLHIVKMRYARGEITKDEFEKMKDTIAKDFCEK